MTNNQLANVPEGRGTDLANLNMQQIFWLGDQMALAGVAAGQAQKAAAQAAIKIMAGQALGIDPVSAQRGMFIMPNGTLGFYANLVAARIKASPKYDYHLDDLTDESCTVTFFEIVSGKRVKLGTETFDLEDAKRQGTQNMTKFPKNMLFARALSNGSKFYTPDVMGDYPIYTEGDVVEEEKPEVDEEAELAAAAERLNRRTKAANAGQKGLKVAPEPVETVVEAEVVNDTPEAPEAPEIAPNEPEEPFGTGPGGELHTDGQRKKIMATLNEKGFKADNEKRQVVAGILGLETLISFKTVTFDQASRLIESLDDPTSTPEALRAMFITGDDDAAANA